MPFPRARANTAPLRRDPQRRRTPRPTTASGGAPSGAAGGDLTGTYPNPDVVQGTTTTAGKLRLAASGAATAGRAVEATDSRLSDSRGPSGSAGGDLGGTYPNPTVDVSNGLRESAGPTELTMGAVADGDVLTRVGLTVAGRPTYSVHEYATPQAATQLNIPTWARHVDVFCVGAFGGGGGGRGDPAAGVAHGGGGGGGTGALARWSGAAKLLGPTLWITVGTGGIGGNGTNNSTTGATGGAGTASFVATTVAASGITSTQSLLVYAAGGSGGVGGSTAGGAGGAAGAAMTSASGTPLQLGVWVARAGTAGGAGGAGANAPDGALTNLDSPVTGGRGGGGCTAAGGVTNGGAFTGAAASGHFVNQSAGASNAGGAGVAGGAGQVPANAPWHRGGGTGGGAGGAGNGGAGGSGAAAGPGGGGGASIGGTGGRGGDGGPGYVLVVFTG